MADRREGVDPGDVAAWLVRLGLCPRILLRHAIIEVGGISKANRATQFTVMDYTQLYICPKLVDITMTYTVREAVRP